MIFVRTVRSMAPPATAARSRALTIADAPELAALALRLGGSETAGQWASFLSRPAAIGIAAVADGAIVGYAAGEVRTGFGLPEPAGWVEAFGIGLEQRGHGVGRALLEDLLRRFIEAGATHVYTVVPVHDHSLAPFLRQLGFRDEPLSCLGHAL